MGRKGKIIIGNNRVSFLSYEALKCQNAREMRK